MAEYGIRITNDSGIVQIDGNYRNFQLINKGVAVPDTTVVGGAGEYFMQSKTLQFTGLTNPIIVIYCTDQAFVTQSLVNGVHAFSLYRRKTNSSSIEWWLFDDVKPAPVSGWGTAIRNQANQIVYNTNLPPFRVAGIVERSVRDAAADFAFTPGRKYAYVPCRMGEFYDVALGPGSVGSNPTVAVNNVVSCCAGISGGVRIGNESWYVFVGNYNQSPQMDAWNSIVATWLIVDVTNL
ncbi:MAG: hypothetical protein DI555_06600 [Novosphingobium pentaromativorans]|uniref:Uncharacterized protein n=1 Tax=Novosphingobium pentaromativorans TaxID=205844 RepID=A0A2W5NVB1_9SPHN|nr:MAG: hypothetical protein DI555_06600 [Novosphingobium pentaromativorans]